MTSSTAERLTVVPEPAPEVPPEVPADLEVAPNARPARGPAREAAARLFRSRAGIAVRGVVQPPDIVRSPQPSLQQVWRHAVWGEQVPPGTIARPAYIAAWVLFCSVPVTFGYLVAWWHQRLARLVVGYLTLWAVCLLPPVRAVLEFGWHWFTTLARIVT